MIEIPYNFEGTIRYQRYHEIVDRVRKFDQHFVIGKDESGTYDMYAIELGSRSNPTLFIGASMHGTEYATTQYSIAFMEMLRDNTFPDKTFREELLKNYHILYVPVINPWGLDRVDDIYRQFNNEARYNSTHTELNNDFYNVTQQETKNIVALLQEHRPFAAIDLHMFQPAYDVAYGRNLIWAGLHPETHYVRDRIVESIEAYAGQEVTVWTNVPTPESGLLRTFVGYQSNPYTPFTLSYISEIVRPARINGQLEHPLSFEEIYKYGVANLYLFCRTSIDYLHEHWQPIPETPIEQNPTTRLVVRDKDMRRIGELENAYDVSVERRVNELWTASFSLPKDDPKQYLCDHLNYIEIYSPSGRYMGLYRIMPTETRKAIETNRIIYRCEHVLATLMDDVMEGYHQFTNYSTRYVLQSILDLQEVARWQLGEVEFERYFHYSFENENGLLAPILSIPQPFDEPYEFTFDTTVYPWKLNLVKASNDVKAEIRWGKDMIDFEEVSDPTDIVNYIIPKGSGEGVNQLTIESVNDGKKYLKDDKSIEKWGKRAYIWIDQRFEDAESLKASAESLLRQWKDPTISFTCSSVDLSVKPEYSHERKILNGVTRIIVEDQEYLGRILAEKIADLNKEWEVEYEIGNKIDDIATTQADLERKQQVNEAYSQGATNILSFNYQDNCDSNIPAVIPFYIDDDVVNINTCELTFRTRRFRAYSRTTEGGGGVVTTTKSGGGTTATSSAGGGTTATSSSGGGVSRTTSSGGGSQQTSSTTGFSGTLTTTFPFGTDNMEMHTHNVNLAVSQLQHNHTVNIPSHTHNFEVPNHTHTVTIPNHTHDVTIPDHTHDIELPDHTHDVKHEIVELNETASSVEIRVDENLVPFSSTTGNRINLIPYMQRDQNGKVTRGRHEVTISPNNLARIEADVILRVFIRSHLGTTV